jgi:hypothetical protein
MSNVGVGLGGMITRWLARSIETAIHNRHITPIYENNLVFVIHPPILNIVIVYSQMVLLSSDFGKID